MGTLAGLIVGYVVGAGTGPEGYRKLREAWEEIQASDEWKGLVATASGFVQNALARGGTAEPGANCWLGQTRSRFLPGSRTPSPPPRPGGPGAR